MLPDRLINAFLIGCIAIATGMLVGAIMAQGFP